MGSVWLKFWAASLVACAVLLSTMPASAGGGSRDRFQSIEGEIRSAALQGGRPAIEQVMLKHGWKPMLDQASPVAGQEVDPQHLHLDLYAFRHDRNLEVAVYSEYKWDTCDDRERLGSYDILGIDWDSSNSAYPLSLIRTGSTNDNFVWYRGEKPSSKVITFNVRDCYGKTLLWRAAGTAWGVFSVPSGAQGIRFTFNSKYEHSFLTVSQTETWSAGLKWESDKVTGVAGYEIELKTIEAKLERGDVASYRW